MDVQFKNAYLADLFQGKAVKGKPRYNNDVVVKFKKTILKLQNADSYQDLKDQRGLNLEALKGDLKGYHSVRVDRSYRLILILLKDGTVNVADVIEVHDLTNHYQ